MSLIATVQDGRYALFEKLLHCIKNNVPQIPHSLTEVSTRLYTDPHWFQREQEGIFSDVPLIVGFSSMLTKPGDHFTFDYADKPLLIVRGKDGQVRCFINVCRHRGVRLSNAEDISEARTFSCPYHHWTYDLEGALIFVPTEESFPGLDKSCRSLKEVPVAEGHGFIWVNPRLDGEIKLDQFLSGLGSDFDNFDIPKSYFFKQTTHVCKSNWKLIIEAFEDGYHVTRLHSKTVGPFFKDNMAVQERVGPHIRSIVARNEIEHVMDASKEKWDFRNHGSFAYFIWPNTIIIIHPDYTSQLSLFPVSVDETIMVHNCVVNRKPQSEKEAAHFERGFKLIDEGVFSQEDFYVCEQAQIGMNSGANETLLIGGYESGILSFHQSLEEAIGPYE